MNKQNETLSAPAPSIMILKMKSTVSQIFPMTEEWDWTLSSREARKPHSPMVYDLMRKRIIIIDYLIIATPQFLIAQVNYDLQTDGDRREKLHEEN